MRKLFNKLLKPFNLQMAGVWCQSFQFSLTIASFASEGFKLIIGHRGFAIIKLRGNRFAVSNEQQLQHMRENKERIVEEIGLDEYDRREQLLINAIMDRE